MPIWSLTTRTVSCVLPTFSIPLNSLLDAVLELGLRQPAQLVVDFSRIDGVTHIVTLTITNMCDQALRLAQFFADDLHDLDILLLVMAADIIDFTNATLVDNQVDSLPLSAFSTAAVNLFFRP